MTRAPLLTLSTLLLLGGGGAAVAAAQEQAKAPAKPADWHAFHGGGPLTGEAAGAALGASPELK